MQRVTNDWKCQQRDRIQQEHRPHGNADLFLIGARDGSDSSDRASPTNRGAGGDEIRSLGGNLQHAAQKKPQQHGAADADRGVHKTRPAGMDHLPKIHSETQRHDRYLQQQSRQRTALAAKGMLDGETKSDATGQRDRGRHNPTRRQQKSQEEDGSVSSHDTTLGIFRTGVQTEILMRD